MPRRSRTKRTGTAKKALRLAKKNRRELRGELKYFDLAIVPANIASDVPLVYDLMNAIARGTGHNELIGDTIRKKSLLIRGVIKWDATDPDAVIRLILLRMNDDTATAPVVMAAVAADENVLVWSATDSQKPLMPLNLHNNKRYKVLWDELLIGNPDSVDGLVFKRYFKLNHKAHFNANADQKKGALYLCLISDEPSAQNPPTINFQSRVRYVDN